MSLGPGQSRTTPRMYARPAAASTPAGRFWQIIFTRRSRGRLRHGGWHWRGAPALSHAWHPAPSLTINTTPCPSTTRPALATAPRGLGPRPAPARPCLPLFGANISQRTTPVNIPGAIPTRGSQSWPLCWAGLYRGFITHFFFTANFLSTHLAQHPGHDSESRVWRGAGILTVVVPGYTRHPNIPP